MAGISCNHADVGFRVPTNLVTKANPGWRQPKRERAAGNLMMGGRGAWIFYFKAKNLAKQIKQMQTYSFNLQIFKVSCIPITPPAGESKFWTTVVPGAEGNIPPWNVMFISSCLRMSDWISVTRWLFWLIILYMIKISSVGRNSFPPPSQRFWNLFMAHFCLVPFFPVRMTHIFKALAVEPLDETAPLAFERACAELITAGSPGVSRRDGGGCGWDEPPEKYSIDGRSPQMNFLWPPESEVL